MRRVIFTLLYNHGQFMLSRNFRLQVVGSIDWLFDNYDFGRVSQGLDELMVLDVSRGIRAPQDFGQHVSRIASRCFIPMTVGGGVNSLDLAHAYMQSGADKLLVNSAFASDPGLCRTLASHYGTQCIVAGIDYRRDTSGRRTVATQCGDVNHGTATLSDWTALVQEQGAGEILFQSIDRDGTGMGLDLELFEEFDHAPEVPCILMGGVGKADHIVAGLGHPDVDAVATANLFNFIGDAFLDVRASIVRDGIEMPRWSSDDYDWLEGRFSQATTSTP
jgi:imidazole glycerol-phosphate synthase subunit HisF